MLTKGSGLRRATEDGPARRKSGPSLPICSLGDAYLAMSSHLSRHLSGFASLRHNDEHYLVIKHVIILSEKNLFLTDL
jgi:hypothetical protein